MPSRALPDGLAYGIIRNGRRDFVPNLEADGINRAVRSVNEKPLQGQGFSVHQGRGGQHKGMQGCMCSGVQPQQTTAAILNHTAPAVVLNPVAHLVSAAKHALPRALEATLCGPSVPDGAKSGCLNPRGSHRTKPVEQPAGCASRPSWRVLPSVRNSV